MTVHYRTLSREANSRESFSEIDPPGLRSRGSKVSEDALLLRRAYSSHNMHSLPRNYRNLRASACAGWSVAALLLLTLVFANSTTAGSDGALRIPGLSFGGWRTEPLPQELVPKGGVKSRVTIVSGFFQVDSGKKHSVADYNRWLANFLQSVELPIVFFCAPSQRAFITELRGSKPITIISNFETPFEMPPLVNLGGRDWAIAQHAIDPEKHVHVPDVYGVWTAKPWIVKQAAILDPYLSEFFFWVDAGAFRDASVTHTFLGLPAAVDLIFDKVPEDTLVLSSTSIPFERGTTFVKAAVPNGIMDRADRLQGGWYGGRRSAVEWWERETMKVTRIQAGLQRFAAKEQPVWTQAARLNWPKIYVQNMAERNGDCGPDMWFGFEYFADGRDCHVPAWVGPHYAKLEGRQDQWNETMGVKGFPRFGR